MSVGTVEPKKYNACIKDVTFRNIRFYRPLKGIYIKTNPGSGVGIIQNITYENIVMTHPIWWAIYIGPQQQKQPNGGGPGCMIYPLNEHCDTQPRVTIKDITLRNITSHGSLLPPGIIRCNETNPCNGFVFEDINMRSFLWDTFGFGFISEAVYGTVKNVHPDPKFLKVGEPVLKQTSYFNDSYIKQLLARSVMTILEHESVKGLLNILV
jgi:hypothetical protein